MPTKGLEIKDVQVMLDDGKWYPLGKVESAELTTVNDPVPDGTIGIDMKDFVFSDSMEFTAEIKVDNPLRLKLQLLGMPVVSVIMCKNCWKRNKPICPMRHSNFGPNDTCSRGELKL